MIVDGKLYVTNSILNAVATCDTKALLAHKHRLAQKEQAAAPFAGTSIHAALAHWLKGNSEAEALEVFDSMYAPFATESVPDADRLGHANVRAVLDNFMASRPLHTMPFTVNPKLVEITFNEPLTDDIVLVGTIDALVEMDGAYYVLDWKTTGQMSSWWAKKFRTSPQITGYAWAAGEQCHLPVVGGFIGGIEIKSIPNSTRKCTTHGVTYAECGVQHLNHEILGPMTRTPEQTEAWKHEAIYHAIHYRELLTNYPTLQYTTLSFTQGMFNDSCSLCDFYDFCANGRPLNLIGSMFGPSSYDPFKGVV